MLNISSTNARKISFIPVIYFHCISNIGTQEAKWTVNSVRKVFLSILSDLCNDLETSKIAKQHNSSLVSIKVCIKVMGLEYSKDVLFFFLPK